MMNCSKLIYNILSLSLFSLAIASCRKETSSTNGIGLRDYGQGYGQCRLVETRDSFLNPGFTPNWTIPKFYVYDDFLKLCFVTVTESSGYRFYYDSKNVYHRIGHWTGITPDSIAVDEKGKIVANYREDGKREGTDYFYSPSGEMRLSVHYGVVPIRIADDSTFCQFENGDLIKKYNKTDTISYTYYLNEPFQLVGDGRTMDDLRDYGRVLIKTRHLVKSISNQNGKLEEYAYEFDNEHKITKVMVTGMPNLPRSMTYVRYFYYRCD